MPSIEACLQNQHAWVAEIEFSKDGQPLVDSISDFIDAQHDREAGSFPSSTGEQGETTVKRSKASEPIMLPAFAQQMITTDTRSRWRDVGEKRSRNPCRSRDTLAPHRRRKARQDWDKPVASFAFNMHARNIYFS
jgi:hypothetical protein